MSKWALAGGGGLALIVVVTLSSRLTLGPAPSALSSDGLVALEKVVTRRQRGTGDDAASTPGATRSRSRSRGEAAAHAGPHHSHTAGGDLSSGPGAHHARGHPGGGAATAHHSRAHDGNETTAPSHHHSNAGGTGTHHPGAMPEPLAGVAGACLMLAKSGKCQESYAFLNPSSVAPIPNARGKVDPMGFWSLGQGFISCIDDGGFGGCPNNNYPWVIGCCCNYPQDDPMTNYCCSNTTCGV